MTEKHHGYTNHGHPIPGACGIAGQRPKYVARCGGPRVCGTCSLDAERYNESRPDSNEPPTMTDQTPSTEHVERARFNVSNVHHSIGTECLCGARRLHKNRDRTEHILDAFIKELDLAAHDRAVKAEALREAADHIAFEFDLDCDDVAPYGEHQIYMENAHQYDMGQLRKRADRIEAGE